MKFFNKPFFLILLVVTTAYFTYSSLHPALLNAEEKYETEELYTSATVAFVGDLMCHSVQFNYAFVEKDSFNFNYVYRFIKPYFEQADFLVGNLETVTAGKELNYSGYPFFNTPDDYVVALKEAGFNLLTTSNNHSLDKGERGVLRTIKVIKENELGYNGTFLSAGDRDSIRLYNIYGIDIAYLSYTYGTNGIPVPKGKDYLINLIDTVLIRKDINAARGRGAEVIFTHFHFGEEYKREPNQYQKQVVNFSINAGADVVIGGHPHVVQPVEYFSGKGNLEEVFSAYSLGNFFSNQRWRYSDAGVIVFINLIKDINKNETSLSSVYFLPTWVFKGETERGREYIILPAGDYSNPKYKFLSSADRGKMQEAFEDTKAIITKYSSKIKLMPLISTEK